MQYPISNKLRLLDFLSFAHCCLDAAYTLRNKKLIITRTINNNNNNLLAAPAQTKPELVRCFLFNTKLTILLPPSLSHKTLKTGENPYSLCSLYRILWCEWTCIIMVCVLLNSLKSIICKVRSHEPQNASPSPPSYHSSPWDSSSLFSHIWINYLCFAQIVFAAAIKSNSEHCGDYQQIHELFSSEFVPPFPAYARSHSALHCSSCSRDNPRPHQQGPSTRLALRFPLPLASSIRLEVRAPALTLN